MTTWRDDLVEQVRAASIKPPTTKAEAISYYQSKYPEKANKKKGYRSWKQHLVSDLAGITGLKEKNLEKRFDQQRRGNLEPKNKKQYEELGRLIGWKPPKHGYAVHFDGWLYFSSCCEKRDFDVTIVGDWTKEIARQPLLIIQGSLLIYMEEDQQEDSLQDQTASIGLCEEGDETCIAGLSASDPHWTVTANSEQVGSGHSGRKRRFSFFDRR